jgi:hypothetical protein
MSWHLVIVILLQRGGAVPMLVQPPSDPSERHRGRYRPDDDSHNQGLSDGGVESGKSGT